MTAGMLVNACRAIFGLFSLLEGTVDELLEKVWLSSPALIIPVTGFVTSNEY